MRRAVAAIAATLLILAADLHGQAIAPMTAEYQGKARGKFDLLNTTLYPMNVVLEPMSFSVDSEGVPRYTALDPAVKLRLSTTSLRIGPKETYTVFYQAEAAGLPAWFTVYATITGPRPSGGLQIAYRLPHTVYLLPKRGLGPDSVAFLAASVRDSARKVVAVVENLSHLVGRAREVEVGSAGTRKKYAGFPLFPHQRRIVRLDWDQPGTPDVIVLRFEKFDVEHRLSP